ncbi:MAG: hypothetical protein JKY65_15740, partial [Planctomycetes bacterium]|nr:hypothetical protein [Planctomycetota bacterium]
MDPRRFAEVILADETGREKLPELADDFHPSNNPQVAATLGWASRQGQAILVGDADGDFDVMHCQVHLNLDAPMLGERFAPYGHLHLMLHDLTHHYLGQIRVRPEDVATPAGLEATRKKIHQAAMLGELVASFTTVGRVIPAYSNWRSKHLGEGRAEQYGGFFSFAKDERSVVEGFKQLYGGGPEFTEFLKRELSPEIVADYRAAGDWLVWPSLPFLFRASSEKWKARLARFEAWAMPKVLPYLLPWSYWNRSVYGVAAFQSDCRHLADRYTSPWHMEWQADFNQGASFEEVIERCHTAFRGVAARDFGFFANAASDDLEGADYHLNVRRQQIRHFARKVYELEHHLRHGDVFQGDEAARESWLTLLDDAGAVCRDLFATLATRDADERYAAEFLPLRERLLARQTADADLFDVAGDRSDFLENPNRQLEDPGVRDANSKAPTQRTWRQRWAAFKAGLRSVFGAKVVAEEREWVLEIYAGLDHEAVFDEIEAAGIPTAGREVPPSVS